MKTKFYISLFLALSFSFLVEAAKYKLDESHTTLGFKIRHLGISTVRGHFSKFSGMGQFDEDTKKIKALQVKIDTGSIDTNEPDRDTHLRSDEFFDVQQFPQMTFQSTEVKYQNGIPSQIIGTLFLHGVTKQIILEVIEWGGTGTDPWGNQRVAFEATAKIDRRDFGLTWNKGLKKQAGVMVGNEVTLELNIQGLKLE